ncbi:hypothetical protein SAMN02745148_03594 [Modicisalibacter ilicicola DSM 19980]|uniref:Addiction module antidote protein, HigA family n=1 Tax=Modicisalibacter ilicicola DSM 19980 TaxID=1121942 RepID=A0A1M5EPR4_9GAMM|nr:hypothetical protein SAMN02745148_03594 [Halomonas ilicicola DSM 19980]
MIRIPTHREPIHPVEVLLEEFLNPMHITQRELSAALHYQGYSTLGMELDAPIAR